ncbi:MAG: inner membrane CreD family protein [Candidatus Udaeobacter sp.]
MDAPPTPMSQDCARVDCRRWIGGVRFPVLKSVRQVRSLHRPFGPFSWAYLIAAVASIALITWYCRFFLGGGVRTLMIGAGLSGLYTFLYITLRQQDYALLMGAIALFIVLAIVMYVTRKVDWYARDAS